MRLLPTVVASLLVFDVASDGAQAAVVRGQLGFQEIVKFVVEPTAVVESLLGLFGFESYAPELEGPLFYLRTKADRDDEFGAQERCQSAGAKAYLLKPIQEDALIAAIIKGEHDEISNLVYEAIVPSRRRWKLA